MDTKKLEDWFYPHANQIAKAAGMPEWKGRVPILVEDAWNYKQQEVDKLLDLFKSQARPATIKSAMQMLGEKEVINKDKRKLIKALKDVLDEVGTSTLANKICTEALKGIGEL
jgi:hypothetical protein